MDTENTPALTQQHSRQDVRRSFILGVANGSLFRLAETMIEPSIILTWFVSQLTTSNFLIGLVIPLTNAGWFLPQLLFSPLIHRRRRKMPVYAVSAVVRVLSWLSLAGVIWLSTSDVACLVSFFVLYTMARLASGPAGVVFFDVVAKTIPARRRGRFFAWRFLLGGLLGLLGGAIVNRILSHPVLVFPRGHASLFLLYGLIAVPAFATFTAIDEPLGAGSNEAFTLRDILDRSRDILSENRVYRRFLLTRMTVVMAGMALPFYTVYAKNVLNAPESMAGIYVAVRVGAQLIANLPWGWFSDRYGNRLVLKIQIILNGANVITALVLAMVVSAFHFEGPWLPYLALPLFFIDGAVIPSYIMGGSNYLIELVPEEERTVYTGLTNTSLGVIILTTSVGGLIVDLVGFSALFTAAAGFYILGFLLAGDLPEPRDGMG